jgi:beta-phosphoglucomutase-like phosphatase (HAD superfamily)
MAAGKGIRARDLEVAVVVSGRDPTFEDEGIFERGTHVRGATRAVVFFDLGDTLAKAVVSPTTHRLNRLEVLPGVLEVLQALRAAQVRLGLISNTGDEPQANLAHVLQQSGLAPFFPEAQLLLYSSVTGLKKDSPAVFKEAAKRAGNAATPSRCLYVGENPQERAFAAAAGWRVVAGPQEVPTALGLRA